MSFFLRRTKVAHFASIIKIASMFIKTTFKESNKIKGLKLCIEMQSVFRDITKVADSREKMLISVELNKCSVYLHIFFNLL